MSIREVIKNLDPSVKVSVFEAFDDELPFHCEYEDGKFIGVHLTNYDDLDVKEVEGVWSIGYYRNRSQKKDG